MIAGKIESVDFERDIREFILAHYHAHDLPRMTVSDLCSNPIVTSMLLSPTSKPSRPLKKVPLEIIDLAMRKIPFDYEGNQASLASVLVTRDTTDVVKVHPAAVVGGHQESPAATAKLENVRFDQLKIDCSSPPAAKNVELKDDAGLRVALAQNVARAIARAHEHRAVVKKQQQSLPSKRNASLLMESSEPENNGGEASKSSVEYRSPSHATTTLQSNDMDDDGVSLSPMPSREDDDNVV